jgi:hypothetical protein
MAFSPTERPGDAEARHSEEWYGDAIRNTPLQRGDRLFVRCEGGPCISRLETFPPRLEIEEQNGLYVLNDDGPVDGWIYLFLPTVDR